MRRASAAFARACAWLVPALFVAELVASFAGAGTVGTPLAELACALLLLVPVVNVVSELVDEIGRRDWAFAAAALVVLAAIAYSVLSRLG